MHESAVSIPRQVEQSESDILTDTSQDLFPGVSVHLDGCGKEENLAVGI